MKRSRVVKRWLQDEDEYLKATFGQLPIDTIKRVLKRTESAIRQRAYRVIGTTLDRAPMTPRK